MAKRFDKSAAVRDASGGVVKTSSRSRSGKSHVVRVSRDGEYVTLKDGRRIVEPPSGGKLKKRDIERAVRTIASERKAAASSAH